MGKRGRSEWVKQIRGHGRRNKNLCRRKKAEDRTPRREGRERRTLPLGT